MAGFEIDNVSTLNACSSESKDCVSQGTGKTGRAAQCVLKFIMDDKVDWALLGNVKNIGQKTVISIITVLIEKGFPVLTPTLAAEDYKAGARRIVSIPL